MRLCLVLVLALFLFGCTCTYQYNVLVKNNCHEQITIHFKSLNNTSGIIEDSIILKPDELNQIITSKNLLFEGGCVGTKAEHCHKVAEYVNAYLHDSVPSKIKWCDESIEFIKSDIQQGEFIITYNAKDFIQ